MAISANTVASSDTLEKLRQEFNNLQSDVDTLNTSGISAASYIFEGATADEFETTLDAIDPTGSDKTVSLPNATTTLVGQDTTDTLTNKTLTAPSITGVVGGTQTSATITTLNGTTLNAGTLTVATGSITDSTGTILFGDDDLTTTGNIKVGNDGTIGSATTADAITISSGGIVTFKDDIKIKDGGTIGSTSTFDAITIAADPAIVTFKDDIIIKSGGTIGVSGAPTAMTIAADGIVSFLDDIKIKNGGTIGSATTANAISITTGGLVNLAIAAATVNGDIIKTAGAESIWVPVTVMAPAATAPCADIVSIDSGNNSGPDLRVLDFNKDSNEHAQFSVCMPKQWDGGNITFKVYWIGIASTDGVSWALQVKALNDAEDVNVGYGTAVVAPDDSQGSTTELLISDESGNIACAAAAADLLFCQIFRDVSDANDDMSGDARLVGIRIIFTTDKTNDD